jgi:cytochrome bd-type quinol oxidase subunit 1
MSDIASNMTTASVHESSAPWPRAVAWLAVVAHLCVADVIGVSSQASDEHLSVLRKASVLFAQADLIVVWLVLGTSLWVRRVPWSLCGLSGIGLVLYMHVAQGESFVLGEYLTHLATTAAALGFLRWRGRRIGYAANRPLEAIRRHQFAIMDLFGAVLATAIAVSWMLRMEPPQISEAIVGMVVSLTALLLPLSGCTLAAALAMGRQRWLVTQIVLAALIAIFVPKDVTQESTSWFCLLYSIHWFLVASTLWIFQMCGYRLVRSCV